MKSWRMPMATCDARAVLVENIELESELRSLYAASEHGKTTDTNSLH
jgi:hypothetical protein